MVVDVQFRYILLL